MWRRRERRSLLTSRSQKDLVAQQWWFLSPQQSDSHSSCLKSPYLVRSFCSKLCCNVLQFGEWKTLCWKTSYWCTIHTAWSWGKKLLNFPTICPFSLSFPWKRDKIILQDYTGCKMNFLQKRTDVCLCSSRDKRLVCVSSPANRFCSCVHAQNRGLYCPVTPVTDSLPLIVGLQL